MNVLTILISIMLISYAGCDFTVQKARQMIPVGNGASYRLRCTVSPPDVFDKWSNPQLKIPISKDPSLSFVKNGDNYDVVISRMNFFIAGNWTCSTKQNKSDYLMLRFPPSVVTPAEEQQILVADRPGAVKIDIRGYPKPTFFWKKDGKELNITGRYSITDNGTLLISKVERGDAGNYTATGDEDNHIANSGIITVTIHVAPSIVGSSIRENRTVGGSITFNCTASGVPPPSVTWLKGSMNVKDGGRVSILDDGLRIADIKRGDEGDYTCVATNSAGTKTLTSTLISVHVPPSITALENRTVEKLKTLVLTCKATGSPLPDVEWSKDGSVLTSADNIGIVSSPGLNNLTIDNIKTEQAGVYVCSATNLATDAMGNKVKRTVSTTVTIVYPPEFLAIQGSHNVRINKPVTISCAAIGAPVPDMKLFHDGNEVTSAVTSQNASRSSLVYSISKVLPVNLGVYTCTAKNDLKTIQTNITLNIPLDKPDIMNVKSTCSNVTFSWKADGHNYTTVKSYFINVRKVDGGILVKSLSVDGNTTNVSLSGLDEKTAYELSVRQFTDVPGLGFTSSKKMTTSKCPLKEMNHVVVVGNNVTVYWPDVTHIVTGTQQYIVRYRTKNSSDPWEEDESDTVFLTISGLQRGKTYEFQVLHEVGGKKIPYTTIRDVSIELAPTTAAVITTSKGTTTVRTETTERASDPPAVAARSKGLSGGAIAGIVIVIIIVVLVAVDIFCCFFNQCGVVHLCAATCAGSRREKYNVDGTPEEETKLKELNEHTYETPAV